MDAATVTTCFDNMQSADADTAIAALKEAREWFDKAITENSASGPVLKLLLRFQKPSLQAGALFAAWDQHAAEKSGLRVVVHILYVFRSQLRGKS